MPETEEGKKGEIAAETGGGNGSNNGEHGKGSSSGEGGSSNDLPENVKSYIDSKFDSLKELIEGTGGKKEGKEGEANGTGTPPRATLQAEAERLVREASKRLEEDTAHQEAHKRQNEKEKKEAEKPPIKQGRFQKFMFGAIDE